MNRWNHPIRILFFAVSLLVGWPDFVAAQQVVSGISAHEAYVDSQIVFQIQIRNAESQEPPVVPQIDGLKIVNAGTPSRSTNLTIINGRRNSTTTVTYSYRVTPEREGTFTIPALEVTVNGERQTTEPHTFVVTKSETGDLLFAEISSKVEQAFVGQPVPLTLRVWVRPYADRGFEYRFTEGDMWQRFSNQTDWGIFTERLTELTRQNKRPGGYEVLRKDSEGVSHAYVLYELETTMYPQRPGKIDPGTAKIVVDYPTKLGRARSGFFDDGFGPTLFDRFTNRRRVSVISSRPISVQASLPPIQVMDVPVEGRPASYRGAVGQYRIVAQTDTRLVKVGDAIPLQLVIQGDGPMELVEAPPLAQLPELTQGFRVDEEALAGFVQDDAKLFSTSLRPLSTDVTEIPAIPFSFFDPQLKQYRTVTTKPISITVQPAETLSLDAIVANKHQATAAQTPRAADSPGEQDEWGLLGVTEMMREKPIPVQGRHEIHWLLYLAIPVGCGVGVVLLKREVLLGVFRSVPDPLQQARRVVREAITPSQIRDALEPLAPHHAELAVVCQACDEATFGGRARMNVEQLRESALTALRRAALALVLCWVGFSPRDSAAVESTAAPQLHLTRQQIQILLDEAYALQQEGVSLQETDPQLSKSKLQLAIAKYQLVVQSGFRSASLQRNLGDAYRETEDWGRALAAYEQGWRLSPRDRTIADRLAEAQNQLGIAGRAQFLPRLRGVLRRIPGWCYTSAAVFMWTSAWVGGTILLFRQRRVSWIPGCLLVSVMACGLGIGLIPRLLADNSEALAVVDNAELRSSYGSGFPVVATLRTGDRLDVRERRGPWLFVATGSDSVEGWVHEDSIQGLN